LPRDQRQRKTSQGVDLVFQRISVIILLLLPVAALTEVPALALSPAVRTIQQAQTSSAPVNNQDVIRMVKAGLAPELIVAKIKASRTSFDTSPETLKQLQTDGLPGEIIMAMIVAGERPRVSETSRRSSYTLPRGTVVDFETCYPINSQEFRNGDAISFRVVNPVVVNDAVVIVQGATATGVVTKAERNGHWGRAGRITWAMKEVTAVDGNRIPLEFTGHTVGDSKGAKVAAQTIAMGALMGPLAPIALLSGFKRGENAYIPAGKRYQATVRGDANIMAFPMR
jgi:hypothetical protein